MPLRVLADLFGMPREDRHLIFDWSNALLGADNPSAGQHADDAMLAMAGLMAYGQEMAADRRAEPRAAEHTSELQSLIRSSYAAYCLTLHSLLHQHNTHKTQAKSLH